MMLLYCQNNSSNNNSSDDSTVYTIEVDDVAHFTPAVAKLTIPTPTTYGACTASGNCSSLCASFYVYLSILEVNLG